jgi:hypothetical protein
VPFSILIASNASRPVLFSTRSAAAANWLSKDAAIRSLVWPARIPNWSS